MRNCTYLLIALISFGFIFPATSSAESAEEIRERLRQLREERERIETRESSRDRSDDERSAQSINESIRRYERTLDGCEDATGFQRNICAEAIYSLGRLYYQRARNEFVQAQNRYEEAFAEWNRNPVGDRPTAPRPDYTQALRTYQQAVEEYPESNQLANAYFQIGGIYNLRGEVDSSMQAYKDLIEHAPDHRLVNNAHFRIAQMHFDEFRHRDALRHLKEIDMSQLTAINRELAHYRKSEIYYNIGDLLRSAEMFAQYVDNVDRDIFPRGDLRRNALDYISLAFSDLPEEGAQHALDYFDRVGQRTYEDTVIYEVGFKNFEHGQYDQAILALSTAMERFPHFERAPKAQMRIMNAHIINRRYEEANAAREELIERYHRDGSWAANNRDNAIALAQAEEHVKDAISSTALYYHSEAQKDTTDTGEPSPEGVEKYQQALAMYNRFISDFDEDEWRVYQYHYYAGDIYSVLGEHRKAAEYYDFVAQADLSEYADYTPDMGDTVGMSEEMIEELRREQEQSVEQISQEEAGYNAIASLNELRKQEMKERGLSEEESYDLASTREFIEYIHSYQRRFSDSEDAAEVLLLAASVQFDGKDYAGAIKDCKTLLASYDDEDIIWDARKLLADAFAADRQFDKAVHHYDILIQEGAERESLIALASGTLFNKANYQKNQGAYQEATETFRSIDELYPESEHRKQAWFEAGLVFQEIEQHDSAAVVFSELPHRFPEAEVELRRNAYGRAAINFAYLEKYEEAAKISIEAAENIGDTAMALAFFSTAADYYDTAQAPNRAGEVMVEIYNKYPLHEKTPAALYRAGDFFENRAENYERAIEVYTILAEEFPETDEGLDGAFSIGYCYKAMGDQRRMADAFAEFAKNFSRHRPNQIQALIYATRAYVELDDFDNAELNVRLATRIYDEYKDEAAIAPELGAEAYYTYGQLNHEQVLRFDLSTGANEREVQGKIDDVREIIEKTVEAYTLSMEQQIREWVVKSLYQLAKLNYDYARMYEERKVFGDVEDQIVGRAQALKGVCPGLYDRAIENLSVLIERAEAEGIESEYIPKARELVVESGYRKALLLKEVGILYRDAPMPAGLSAEEEQIYMDELYDHYLQYIAASVPYYEETIDIAINLHIGHNEWIDSIQKEIEMVEIETMGQITSEYKQVDLDEILQEYRESEEAQQARIAAIKRRTADERKQALATIDRIANSEMPIEEKIERLMEIEENARRALREEEEKIREYREILGINEQ
ncbi:tetratricopeptide repeat protein [Chitinivibrio alkaliphilus]|nr:tetratricopeptide repeat protein [Chitinivibrio alkaliphilus]